jgi:TIR domain-containing protein
MQPTEQSLAAMHLGQQLQFLKWSAFQGNYAEERGSIAASLKEIDLELEVPETVEELSERHDEVFHAIYQHLSDKRARLGGDVLALTMFVIGYLPLEVVLSAAWESENYEPLLVNLMLALNDLEIGGELEAIRGAVDTETRWLAQKAEGPDKQIDVVDAARATQRLAGRIFSLWQAARRYGEMTVQFDQLPYHSVFISYSTADEAFCQKLYDALSDSGMRVWFAPHDVRPGRKIEHQIAGAIEQYDKLLLVLSDASMQSQWVETELYKAYERERATKAQILFPISLVPYEQIRAWKAFDADTGRDMAREVREYFIPDLSGWADDELFEREVQRLTQALMVEEPAGE